MPRDNIKHKQFSFDRRTFKFELTAFSDFFTVGVLARNRNKTSPTHKLAWESFVM